MPHLFLLAAIILMALAVNIPLGYLRQNYPKFSFGWYFYIHISIPFIIYARVKSGFSWKFIPFTLAAAVAGQLIGSALKRRRNG
jgi:hypothetical protein